MPLVYSVVCEIYLDHLGYKTCGIGHLVLDTDPEIAAKYHCNKHVVKMILESAQMLCAAARAEACRALPQ